MLGNSPDSCLDEYGLSSEQKYGCPDADGDGWSDDLDEFPDDSQFWSDSDSDTYPDQQGAKISDDCPDEAGDSFEDRMGCLDSDGDGWSDKADFYPEDASRHEESSITSSILVIAGIAIVAICLGLLLVRKKRVNGISSTSDFATIPPISQVPTQTGPQLPPEGLPVGWTMEQWAWYGDDYLKNR
jgi:LPXTG-motif cell wall-anchored protein